MGLLFLTKRIEFSSSHFYFNPLWDKDKNAAYFGKEANTHGHNYFLDLSLEGEVDPVTGMVINTVELKERVVRLLEEFDHKHLNLDLPYFRDKNPSPENIAKTLGDIFQKQNKDLKLSRVRVYENEERFADSVVSRQIPQAEKGLAYENRTYPFCAAHRLHSKHLSMKENQSIYGKCNNPNSHGHNYALEVTIKGNRDSRTGKLEGIENFHLSIQKEIVDRYDHHYLDQDFEEFKEKVSTAENILVIIWERLSPFLPDHLFKLRLVETRDNYFEYYG
jgi:6-pyruvoyltetrahydropterin/6-carboxytetrahydropterin synthase